METNLIILIILFIVMVLIGIGLLIYIKYKQMFTPKVLMLTKKYGYILFSVKLIKQHSKYIFIYNNSEYVTNPSYHKPYKNTYIMAFIENNSKQQPFNIHESRCINKKDPNANELKKLMEEHILSQLVNTEKITDNILILIYVGIFILLIVILIINIINMNSVNDIILQITEINKQLNATISW